MEGDRMLGKELFVWKSGQALGMMVSPDIHRYPRYLSNS